MPTLRPSRVAMFLAMALAASCTPEDHPLSGQDVVTVYAAAIRSLSKQVGVDSLVVDPRPRYLTEVDGGLRMGDVVDYDDPLFARALKTARVQVCESDPRLGCRIGINKQIAALSEILPIGPRDVGLLASFIDVRSTPVVSRGFVMRFRFASGAWHLARVSTGDYARTTWD